MKKILRKPLAVILAVLMMFSVAPAFTYAIDAAEVSTTPVPVIAVGIHSETKTGVVIRVSLEENTLECLDLKIVAADGLTLTSIDMNKNLPMNLNSSNVANGMLSFACTEGIEAPVAIADYTYTKSSATGIDASDFTVTVETCYIGGEGSGNEIEVTEQIVPVINIPAEHVHAVTGGWTTVTPATCTEDGSEKGTCEICDETVIRSIPSKGHGKTRIETAQASCEEAGYTKEICTVCNETVKETPIAATGHQNLDVKVTATCTKDGYTITYCKDCGKDIRAVPAAATGHPDGKTREEIQPATCTKDGYKKIICTVCNEVVDTIVLPKTGHTDTTEEIVKPTCTEDGYKKVTCNICKEVIEHKVLKKTGHLNLSTEKKDPTCTEEGYERVTCGDCNQVITSKTIDKLPHVAKEQITKNPTCTEDGYIRVLCECGTQIGKDQVLPMRGHTHRLITIPATCTTNGSRSYKCIVCGDVKPNSTTVLNKTGHAWGGWQQIEKPTVSSDGLERRVCGNCGDSEERAIPKLTVPAREIILSTEEVTMDFKKVERLYANVLPTEAGFSTVITWESSNEKVATVNENGEVLAVGVGTATITAKTSNGLSDTCTVTVKYNVLQWIIVYLLFGWIWYV